MEQPNETYQKWRKAGIVTGFAFVAVIFFGPNIVLSIYTGQILFLLLWPQDPITRKFTTEFSCMQNIV